MNRALKIVLFVLISALFIYLRLYNIQNSLFFFNDTGRDFLVLQDWRLSGKPPFLGPQNSALPINQSALYFYLLYPLFLLTNQSPISPVYTAVIFYLASFTYCLWITHRDKSLSVAVFVSFFLITIHPQTIIQTRSVWNPTFVAPALLGSLLHLLLFVRSKKVKDIYLFSTFLSLALSMSYSAAVLLFAALVVLLVYYRQFFLHYLVSFMTSFFLFNLPTILFEIRHKFLLTSSLFSKPPTLQERLELFDKFSDLANLVIGASNPTVNIFILSTVLLILLYLLIKQKSSRSFIFLSLLSFTFLLLTPFTIRSQYIFGLTVPLFLLVALLPLRYLWLPLILSLVLYLKPSIIKSYFNPAPRTYAQMELCFKSVCSETKDPIFVSVDSNYHPYHFGPEHRYLLKKIGCNVKNIESENGTANLMALVNDNGSFDPATTRYYELDLFGPYNLTKTYPCADNFQVYLLQKN